MFDKGCLSSFGVAVLKRLHDVMLQNHKTFVSEIWFSDSSQVITTNVLWCGCSLYFPNDYPMNQPRVQFRSRLYHPNIDMDGNMPVLTQWSPTSTVVDVMPDHRLPSL